MGTAYSTKPTLGKIPKTQYHHPSTLIPKSNFGLIMLQNDVLYFERELQLLEKIHPRVVATVQIWPELIEREVSICETERYQTFLKKLNESRKRLIKYIIDNTIVENHFDDLRKLTREVSTYETEEREETQRERDEWLKSPEGIRITAQNEAIMKARKTAATNVNPTTRCRHNATLPDSFSDSESDVGSDGDNEVFLPDPPLHHHQVFLDFKDDTAFVDEIEFKNDGVNSPSNNDSDVTVPLVV